jgi:hypothetical protein
MADDPDYEIGYRKPPLRTRFPPGQSGNPRGRGKGSRGLKTDLEAELKSVHTIRINQQPVTGTKQRLAIKALATRAATGDLKAAALLLPLIIQVLGFEDREAGRRKLSPQDEEILKSLLDEQGGTPVDRGGDEDD